MLHVAVSHKHHEIVKFAIEHGVDVNAEDRCVRCAVHAACSRSQPTACAQPSATAADRYYTADHIVDGPRATRNMHRGYSFGNTPFDDAIREGDMVMAEFLLSKGSRNMDRTDAQVSVQCSALRA